MSTHNIYFRGEIRKILCLICSYVPRYPHLCFFSRGASPISLDATSVCKHMLGPYRGPLLHQ